MNRFRSLVAALLLACLLAPQAALAQIYVPYFTVTPDATDITSVSLQDNTGTFSVTGTPITVGAGTLTLNAFASQSAHFVLGNHTVGAAAPTWGPLTLADMPAGIGTVTSVALNDSTGTFTVAGSPITASGVLNLSAFASQSAHFVLGNHTAGAAAPTWGLLTAADLPAGTGTVTSVGISGPPGTSWANTPVTTAGTLTGTWASESAFSLLGNNSNASAAAAFFAPAGVTAGNMLVGLNNGGSGYEFKTLIAGVTPAVTADQGIQLGLTTANQTQIGTPTGMQLDHRLRTVDWEVIPAVSTTAVQSEPGGATPTVYTAGTVAAFTGTNWTGAAYPTTTTSGNEAGINKIGNFFATGSTGTLDAIMCVRVKTGSAVTSQRIWITWTDADLGAITTPTTQHVAGIRYDTGAGDSAWQMVTCNGTAAAVQSTSRSVTANTEYDFVIVFSGTTVRVYVGTNGNSPFANAAVTTTTDVPSVINLGPEISITTLTTSAATLNIGKVHMEMP